MRLTSGTWITDTVRLVRPLGAGGMSTVWVAADMRLHTQVAVKILSRALLSDKTACARFSREGRLPSEIQSPHLVQIYEEGQLKDGTPFFIMEWLEGETLKSRLQRERRIPPRQALSVVRQLCRALHMAHQIDVVHRDVKADNVFVLRSDEVLVKLLDFGVAKRPSGSDDLAIVTRVGDTLGTPCYMSPEQLRHVSEVDFRADLWSLGVLTYRLYLGALPFPQTTYPALLRAISTSEFIVPSAYDPRWPGEFDDWFRQALAQDPRARFESAHEAADLLELATGSLTNELYGGPPEDDDPPSRRISSMP